MPVIDTFHPRSNNLVKGVKIKVTGGLALLGNGIFSCVLV